MDTVNKLECHHIGIQNSSHYFAFKENIKDMSIREGMLSMYRLDFHESSGTQPALSIEDERFLDKMKEGEQIDANCEANFLFHYHFAHPTKKYPKEQPG